MVPSIPLIPILIPIPIPSIPPRPIAIMTTPLVDVNDLDDPMDDEEEYDAFTAWLTLDEEAQRLDNDMRVAPST